MLFQIEMVGSLGALLLYRIPIENHKRKLANAEKLKLLIEKDIKKLGEPLGELQKRREADLFDQLREVEKKRNELLLK